MSTPVPTPAAPLGLLRLAVGRLRLEVELSADGAVRVVARVARGEVSA